MAPTFAVNAPGWTSPKRRYRTAPGGSIINTASINGLRGNKTLIGLLGHRGGDRPDLFLAQAQIVESRVNLRCTGTSLDAADSRDDGCRQSRIIRRASP